MAVARYVLTLFAMVLGCKEPSDRHASGPGSIQPEPARSGHVHTAQGRVAIQARAELDTLLALNPDAAAGRVATYLGLARETLTALRYEVTYFKLADETWIALADSVDQDITELGAEGPQRIDVLRRHGDRFRRLLDHTEELHDRR